MNSMNIVKSVYEESITFFMGEKNGSPREGEICVGDPINHPMGIFGMVVPRRLLYHLLCQCIKNLAYCQDFSYLKKMGLRRAQAKEVRDNLRNTHARCDEFVCVVRYYKGVPQ